MRAFAYVVAPEGATGGAAVRDLARQAGFSGVQDFRGVPEAELQAQVTPLIFFLFAAVARPAALAPLVQAIRRTPALGICFAPLVYFAGTASIEAIRSCINIGFDDIITLPLTLGRVAERIERQVNRTIVYFETPTYFGPDRRGRMEHEPGHSLRGTGGQHRRFEIVRNPATGVRVVADDAQMALV